MLTALDAAAADVGLAGRRLAGADLRGAVAAFAERVVGRQRVAVVATPTLGTVVAVAGALTAGCTVVPLNPSAGERERAHVLDDSAPDVVIADGDVDLAARTSSSFPAVDSARPAFVVYTSGTTGLPKGAEVSRRAVMACLDGLASVWEWSERDRLAHALPLFHVHGLVLATLGPLRFGSPVVRTPRFEPVSQASMYFAVPTMWARTEDSELEQLRAARLLVSGSASLPAPVFDRVRACTGQALVERYGLTESLIVTAASPAEDRAPGRVGRPLPGVRLRVTTADDSGLGDSGLGEVQLKGPTLFDGYLNRPDATAAAYTDDGWFRTGDLGTYDETVGLRLLGRLATDLVKTGGYKVGAGEVEDALLTHPGVVEAAVVGEPDDDLGERIVAYVVTSTEIDAGHLTDHVARMLAPHKRPRDVRFVDALPRNDMGKVQKSKLR